MSVRYARPALADLDAIVSHISLDNPAAARAVRERIEAVVTLLSRFPYVGRVSDEQGVRVLIVPNYPYRVFYRVYDDLGVVILRVLHAAQERH
jgi:addiction module RelE/StbE family toxin